MIRDAWDCDSPHSRAAAEKLPSRATRVKSLRANMSFTRLSVWLDSYIGATIAA